MESPKMRPSPECNFLGKKHILRAKRCRAWSAEDLLGLGY